MGIDSSYDISSTKENIKVDATPNILYYSLPTKYKGIGQ